MSDLFISLNIYNQDLLTTWRSLDDSAGISTHLLLRLVPSLEPIGTIRIVNIATYAKKLGRLCVLKEYRSFKFGRDLVLASHDHILQQAKLAKESEAESGPTELTISLHSQIYVKGFYTKYVLTLSLPE